MGIKKVLGCVRRADEHYNLIQEGDKICVGVSGGKDSMALLYALHIYKKFCKVNFDVVGIHIKLGFPNMDFTEVEKFCDKNGIEFHSYPSQVYEILKKNRDDKGRLPCSICSKFKKALVIDHAKQHGCNKIAFAHHGDDAIETLLMNAIYGGRIATFLPKMYMSRTDTHFIRPFVYCYEDSIIKAIDDANIPIVKSTCPMDGNTSRQTTKEMLNNLYKEYPCAKDNFLLALHNEKQVALWHHESEEEDV